MTTESFEPSAPHHPAASVTTITAGVEPESLRAVEMFADLRPDELAWIAAHAERVELEPHGAASGPNRLPAMVERIVYVGSAVKVIIRAATGEMLEALQSL